MVYREFLDLDYAMPRQREGGITLSLASNGGEVDWIARDLLQVGTGEALKFLNDEYLDPPAGRPYTNKRSPLDYFKTNILVDCMGSTQSECEPRSRCAV
jgi:hypothetical protein